MNPPGLQLVTGPASEPVSRAEAKLHCRIDADFTDDDTYLDALVTAARTMCEREIGQAFVSQTWKMSIDWFPDWEIRIPIVPLVSVSSIVYTDIDGANQTLSAASYEVDVASQPGRITPAYGESWPAVRNVINAVRITFIAGYTTVPETVKLAIKLLVGQWYENREQIILGTIVADMPNGVRALLMNAWHGSY